MNRTLALNALASTAAATDGTGDAAQKMMCELLRDGDSSSQMRADLLNAALFIAQDRLDDGGELSTTVAFLAAYAPNRNGDGVCDQLEAHIKKSLPPAFEGASIFDLKRPLTRAELNAAGPPPGLEMSYEVINLGLSDEIEDTNRQAFGRVAQQAKTTGKPTAVWIQSGKHMVPVVAEMRNGEVHWHLLNTSPQNINGQPRSETTLFNYLNAEWKALSHDLRMSESGIEAYQWLEEASERMAQDRQAAQAGGGAAVPDLLPAQINPQPVDPQPVDPQLVSPPPIDVSSSANQIAAHAGLLAVIANSAGAHPNPVSPAPVGNIPLGALAHQGISAQQAAQLEGRLHLLTAVQSNKDPVAPGNPASASQRVVPRVPARLVTKSALLAAGADFKALKVHHSSIEIRTDDKFDPKALNRQLAAVANEARQSEYPVAVWVHDNGKPSKNWMPVLAHWDGKNIHWGLVNTKSEDSPVSEKLRFWIAGNRGDSVNSCNFVNGKSKEPGADRVSGQAVLEMLDTAAAAGHLPGNNTDKQAFTQFLGLTSNSDQRWRFPLPGNQEIREKIVRSAPIPSAAVATAFDRLKQSPGPTDAVAMKEQANNKYAGAYDRYKVAQIPDTQPAHPLQKVRGALEALGGRDAAKTIFETRNRLSTRLSAAKDQQSFNTVLKDIQSFDEKLRSDIANAKHELAKVEALKGPSFSARVAGVFKPSTPNISEAKTQAQALLQELELLDEAVSANLFIDFRDFARVADESETARKHAFEIFPKHVTRSSSIGPNPGAGSPRPIVQPDAAPQFGLGSTPPLASSLEMAPVKIEKDPKKSGLTGTVSRSADGSVSIVIGGGVPSSTKTHTIPPEMIDEFASWLRDQLGGNISIQAIHVPTSLSILDIDIVSELVDGWNQKLTEDAAQLS